MQKPIVSPAVPNFPRGNTTQDDHRTIECNDVIESGKSQDKNPIEVEYLDTPVKSENDKKDYRVIKLPNGLTALLISDVQSISDDQINNEDDKNKDIGECVIADQNGHRSEVRREKEDDKAADDIPNNEDNDSLEKERPGNEEKLAACSLCIGVGGYSDPPEIPGMAHLLEHMVFMGSKKYPQENEFDAFIKKHGGSSNASTSCEHTKFYFEIPEKHLFATLDRFAQFFVSPLLKQDAMTREREAVDSEFQLAVTSDSCRENYLLHSFAQPGHPASKFTWGNLVTLRDNVTDEKLYEELHKFRERHYSAHRMTLAFQARLPMDTLEKYVKDCFSTVPNNGLPPNDFTQFKGIQAFDTPNFKRMYKMKPIRDFCKIELTWTMPSLHHLYNSKSHHYVSWIIGHEGKGSLTSYLRKKMWCLDLTGGITAHSSMYGLFTLSIVLTEDGYAHLEDVLDAVFSYISLMQRSGPQKRIYDEIDEINASQFRFVEEISAAGYVLSLAQKMHFSPPSDYITGNRSYSEYNPVEIQACMDALIPDGANIILCNKKFNDAEFDKVEPWFKTKYIDTEIPNDWIEHWRKIEPFPEFHLPEPNIFITDDFSLVPLPEDVPKYPTKIHSDSMSEIWFRPDPKFRIPDAYMYYYFISPLQASTSVKDSVLMDLLVVIVDHLLIEELYPANMAGLSYQIYAHGKGIAVEVYGFNQKLPLLLSTVIRCIAECPNLVTEKLFDVMKAEELKGCFNATVDPQSVACAVGMCIRMPVFWTVADQHAILSTMKFHHFQTFAKQFVDHIYMRCLVQGNITKEDVIKNGQNCIDILKCGSLLPKSIQQLRVNQIPLGERCCRVKNYNKADANSVVTNYYQSGIGNIKISVIIELIMMLMEDPLFNQLRTQEQLGYSVYCSMQDSFGILGYSITVCTQADKFTPEYIDERIEKFLESFLEILKKTSEEEFNIVKVALVKLKQCAALNLYQEIIRHWYEIAIEEYMFDREEREINFINETRIEHLINWMEKHVLGGTNLRKISVQVVGNSKEKDMIEKQSSDENETVTNSEESKVSSQTCDNGIIGSRETPLEYTNNVISSLEYLVDLPNEKKAKPSTYYITDMESFKKSLYIYPDNSKTT